MCPLVRPLQPSQMEAWWFSCCHLQLSPWSLGLSEGSSGLAVRTRPGFRGSGPPSCQGDPHWESSDDLPPFGAKMMVVKKQWIQTSVYALDLRGRKKLGGTFFKGETSRGCWAIFPTDNSMKTYFAFFKQTQLISCPWPESSVHVFWEDWLSDTENSSERVEGGKGPGPGSTAEASWWWGSDMSGTQPVICPFLRAPNGECTEKVSSLKKKKNYLSSAM